MKLSNLTYIIIGLAIIVGWCSFIAALVHFVVKYW